MTEERGENVIGLEIRLAVAVIGLLSIAAATLAQSPAGAVDANAAYQAKDWPVAAKAYESIVAREPENAMAWFRAGTSQLRLRAFDRAVVSLEKAEALGFVPFFTKYNLACAYACLGRLDDGFRALNGAIEAGYKNVEQLKADPDLAKLREDARFPAAVEKTERVAFPCRYDARWRAMDFWVGDWNVFNPKGQQVGTNSIHPVDGGCVVQERWTDALGGTGGSMNFFDTATGKVTQVWVDAQGNYLEMKGEAKDGSVVVAGNSVAPNGTKTLTKMTLTPLPDGRVRQFFETSADEGKTWTPSFEGFYVRKEAAAK